MSNSLKHGDTCPPSTKKKVEILRKIQRGLVIKGYVKGVDHSKYYILMGISRDSKTAYSFFISSEQSLIIITKPQLAHLQIEIRPHSYDFLPKPSPSYINCLKLYEQDSFNMINGLIENPSKMQGYLTPKHLYEVMQATQNNPTLSPDQKNIVTIPLIFPPALCPITTIL